MAEKDKLYLVTYKAYEDSPTTHTVVIYATNPWSAEQKLTEEIRAMKHDADTSPDWPEIISVVERPTSRRE